MVLTLSAPIAFETASSSAFASCADAGLIDNKKAANASSNTLMIPSHTRAAEHASSPEGRRDVTRILNLVGTLSSPLFGCAADTYNPLNTIVYDMAAVSRLADREADLIATE